MARHQFSRDDIRSSLAARIASGQGCDVTSLRNDGLGGMYNAARRLFRSEWNESQHIWDDFVRLVLVANIATINGSQNEGFEHLCRQLARQECPGDATFVANGTPDGGVECFASLTDGGEWGLAG